MDNAKSPEGVASPEDATPFGIGCGFQQGMALDDVDAKPDVRDAGSELFTRAQSAQSLLVIQAKSCIKQR
jgi:hypothetical protein